MSSKLYLGDCLEIMRTMPDKSVDAVITDPPYGIGLANHGAFKGDFSVVGDRDTSLANSISEWSVKRGISAVMFCSPDIQYDGETITPLAQPTPAARQVCKSQPRLAAAAITMGEAMRQAGL